MIPDFTKQQWLGFFCRWKLSCKLNDHPSIRTLAYFRRFRSFLLSCYQNLFGQVWYGTVNINLTDTAFIMDGHEQQKDKATSSTPSWKIETAYYPSQKLFFPFLTDLLQHDHHFVPLLPTLNIKLWVYLHRFYSIRRTLMNLYLVYLIVMNDDDSLYSANPIMSIFFTFHISHPKK